MTHSLARLCIKQNLSSICRNLQWETIEHTETNAISLWIQRWPQPTYQMGGNAERQTHRELLNLKTSEPSWITISKFWVQDNNRTTNGWRKKGMWEIMTKPRLYTTNDHQAVQLKKWVEYTMCNHKVVKQQTLTGNISCDHKTGEL